MKRFWVFLLMAVAARAYTTNSTVPTTYFLTGTLADAQNAASAANPGDTLILPAGNFTWGASGATLSLSTAVTLMGQGPGVTTITAATGAPNGLIVLSAGAGLVVGGFDYEWTVQTSNISPFVFSTLGGARVTNVGYNTNLYTGGQFVVGQGYIIITPSTSGTSFTSIGATSNAFTEPFTATGTGVGINGTACLQGVSYFAQYNNVPGLVDNCYIVGGGGSNELNFARGATNAWQLPSYKGTFTNRVCLENDTFTGDGYVSDWNSCTNATTRMCLILGQEKVDMHGYASNQLPVRSGRSTETYFCDWTCTTGSSWTAFDLRGGTHILFGNTATTANNLFADMDFQEYGIDSQWTNFNNVWQTPLLPPISDQTGTGIDGVGPTVTGPNFVVGTRYVISSTGGTPFTSIGAASDTAGLCFTATGIGTGITGIAYAQVAGEEPAYAWNNTKGGASWQKTLSAIGTGGTFTLNGSAYAIGAGTGLSGDPGLTFTTFATTSTATVYVGDYVSFPGDTTRYKIVSKNSSTKNVTITPGLVVAITTAESMTDSPLSMYQGQTGNSAATFNEGNVIVDGRDMFRETASQWAGTIDATQGTNHGTATNLANTPAGTAGVGFFVSGQGQDWQATPAGSLGVSIAAGKSGLLYVSNGTTWVPNYASANYPDPRIVGRMVAGSHGHGQLVFVP